jgi:hypothetical protein
MDTVDSQLLDGGPPRKLIDPPIIEIHSHGFAEFVTEEIPEIMQHLSTFMFIGLRLMELQICFGHETDLRNKFP